MPELSTWECGLGILGWVASGLCVTLWMRKSWAPLEHDIEDELVLWIAFPLCGPLSLIMMVVTLCFGVIEKGLTEVYARLPIWWEEYRVWRAPLRRLPLYINHEWLSLKAYGTWMRRMKGGENVLHINHGGDGSVFIENDHDNASR